MAVMAVSFLHSATFSAISVRNPALRKNLPVIVVELNSRAKPRVTDIWHMTSASQGQTVDRWLILHDTLTTLIFLFER